MIHKKKLLALLLTLALLLPQAVSAQSQTEIIRKITAAAASMRSLQCDFVQTKHLKMLNDKMVSRGRMYYQQSNKLRWEYTSPYAYTFVLNGQQVKLTKGKRSDIIDVNQSKVFKEIARIMMNSVVGKSLADTKDFKTTVSASSSEYVATLIPQRREMKLMFQKIVLHFSRTTQMVETVELLEKKGDRTIIELKNAKKNVQIAQSLFAIR